MPLDLPGGNVLNPRRHPPQLSPTRLDETPYVNFPLRALNPDAVDVLSDDQVLLSMQYSTQWDSLAHVGALFDADDDTAPEIVEAIMRAKPPTAAPNGRFFGKKLASPRHVNATK